MTTNKIKIFLGDLVHTWEKTGQWTIPINIGYIASYALKYLKRDGIDCSIKLYKDPIKMIDEIKKEKPDVVGLAHYVWNMNLNRKIFDVAKKYYPKSLTVGVGPYFTNHNAHENGAKKFFSSHKNCDSYVVNQGEKGFYQLIKTFAKVNKNLEKIKSSVIPGLLINNLKENNAVHVGKDVGPLEDLNDIPSPYLNGLLDPFFDEPYIPLLETNRSCPYRCTFCAWGIGTQKLMRYDEERILEEIEYIYKRSKLATTLYIADANFSILERDSKFAAKIYEGHKKTGFPNFVATAWNKTRPDRIVRTAKAFNNIAEVGVALQTLDDNVLRAIKRKNLTMKQIVQIKKELQAIGPKEKTVSELILGLPYETKESHIRANKELIDLDIEIYNFNLNLLPGTEMDGEESRKKYFKKTVWRLFDNAYGVYDGEKVFEAQETVIKTNSLSPEDFSYFRFFHFLQQMMWSKKWYYIYLKLLKSHDIHPVVVFDKIAEKCKKDNGEIGNLYTEFMNDYKKTEMFSKFEELKKYWEEEENFYRLEKRDFGKLNMLYTYKIVLKHREAFNVFLVEVAKELMQNSNNNVNDFVELCEEILKFQASTFIRFDNELNITRQIIERFKYDFLGWKQKGYGKLEKLKKEKSYKFYISNRQKEALEIQFKQYTSSNINSTLQMMSVNSDVHHFFYDIAPVPN